MATLAESVNAFVQGSVAPNTTPHSGHQRFYVEEGKIPEKMTIVGILPGQSDWYVLRRENGGVTLAHKDNLVESLPFRQRFAHAWALFLDLNKALWVVVAFAHVAAM